MTSPTGCTPLLILFGLLLGGTILIAPGQIETDQLGEIEVTVAVDSGGSLTASAAWSPVVRDFDGVVMVLVPAGCFEMGSTDGDTDEQPTHQQCFDTPFWIDRDEVTWGQIGDCQADQGCVLSAECTPNPWSSEADEPVNCLTWREAQAICAWRGARLPSEAEWEYAARGPDGLVYPWGNTFDAERVVYEATSGGRVASVGSLPSGASWVGARDMSGNVWEWTSSLAGPYPYAIDEAHETDTDTTSWRVLRGGSFEVYNDLPRAALREAFDPNQVGYNIGVTLRPSGGVVPLHDRPTTGRKTAPQR